MVSLGENQTLDLQYSNTYHLVDFFSSFFPSKVNCFLCFPDERQKIVINRLASDAFIKVLQKRIYTSPITVIKYF